MAAVTTHRFISWPPHWTKTDASSCRDGWPWDAPHPTGVVCPIPRPTRRRVHPFFYLALFGLLVAVPLVAAAGRLHPPSERCCFPWDGRSGLGVLDQPVQLPGDGGIPVGHNVLVAHGRHGGGVTQPAHDLPQRAPGGGREGTGGMAQVMYTQ